MGLAAVLLKMLPSELAPAEDRGFLYVGVNGPEGASLEYMDRHARRSRTSRRPRCDGEWSASTARPGGFGGAPDMSQARGFVLLRRGTSARAARSRSRNRCACQLDQIPGRARFVTRAGGWGVAGAPVQVVLGGTEYADLVQWRDLLMERMEENPA